jgi:hypothetical protein
MNGATRRDGLWEWDLLTNRVHFSPGWSALVGAADHEVSNSLDEWMSRVHPEDAAQVAREIDAVRQGREQAFAVRHRLRHHDDSYRLVTCRGAVVRDRTGRAVRLSGSHTDVRSDVVADPLTGLPSRVLLMERMARALDRYLHYGNLPFALLLIGCLRTQDPQHIYEIASSVLAACA